MSSPPSPPSECPVKHDSSVSECPVDPATRSIWSSLNPFGSGKPSIEPQSSDIKSSSYKLPPSLEESAAHKQTPRPGQDFPLHTSRSVSSIPKANYTPSHQSQVGSSEEKDKWVYPSEQQYFNAVMRKGWKGVEPKDIPEVVRIHNFVNERGWAEDPSPKSILNRLMGYSAPFDRHDWIVERVRPALFHEEIMGYKGLVKEEVRYVIDFYQGTGGMGCYLDVRPAVDGVQEIWDRIKKLR
ncbi:hypothetical protein TrST_g5522 [Triparma strigata]|uniref:Holocytochrome c-type synthase n=1 Tax=Triparma strigata TaxID=1606541 RepID=A0A9W7BH89_9STRA|nr:hypothetical protein TrST_g5522 [Triparma strigata]